MYSKIKLRGKNMNITVNGDVHITNYGKIPWQDEEDLEHIPFSDDEFDELFTYDEYLAGLISDYAIMIEDGNDIVEVLVAMVYELFELGL